MDNGDKVNEQLDADHAENLKTTEVRGWVGATHEARAAATKEHEVTLMEALRLYPKACFWSFAVSLAVIMDGYDGALIGTLQGFPAFQKKFGHQVGNTGTYQVPAKWQSALGLSNPLGNIVGIFINGILTERFGHKKVLIGALVYLTGMIFIPFFSKSIEVLFAGEILCGISWGVFQTMGPAYASEVTPTVLRAYLQTYVVLCWGMGQFISYGVLDGLTHNTTNWAWRIPFAVQWVWPTIIIPIVIFCPESPWWLVRQGRFKDAEKSVKRLSSFKNPDDARNTVTLMIETTELERRITEGATYLDCLRGENLYRTEIGCIAWGCQVLVGFAISSYATYFFEQAGLATSDAYKLTVGEGGLHLLCTGLSVFITARHGRRPIFIWGTLFMSLSMFIVGFLALAKQTTPVGYASSVMYLLWYCGYELTIGPTAYIIVGEVSSTRLRSKSIALARNCYNVLSVVSFVVGPYVLNPTAGNWKGKSGFLAAGFCLVSALWGWFRLPECKGRTYEELDIMFAKRLGAREFGKYKFDRETDVEAKMGTTEHIELQD